MYSKEMIAAISTDSGKTLVEVSRASSVAKSVAEIPPKLDKKRASGASLCARMESTSLRVIARAICGCMTCRAQSL